MSSPIAVSHVLPASPFATDSLLLVACLNTTLCWNGVPLGSPTIVLTYPVGVGLVVTGSKDLFYLQRARCVLDKGEKEMMGRISDLVGGERTARFSRASISFTRSAHRVKMTRACMSIWSRSSFVKCRIPAHSGSVSFKSRVLEDCRPRGAFRESTFKYGFRMLASIRVNVFIWLSYLHYAFSERGEVRKRNAQ